MKKRLLFLAVAAALVLGLAGCGGVLVDYNTPKSEELSAQYDFYSDSQRELSSGMAITPEQADEVFLVLVSCGMDGKVSGVTRKAGDEGHCTISAIGSLGAFDVYYTDGEVDRVERSGKELYPNPEPEEPPAVEAESQTPEKVYEYDTLQNIFMTITENTTAEELQALIAENNLPATVQEYNKSGGGKEVVFCIAYTEGAALQKYADSGDNLEVAFDKVGPDSMSKENRFMYAVYSNASGFSAMLYNYGTWFDFREEAKSNYSGYYIIKHGSKDGITMKYNNGNETATGYFRHDSAEEVIREMIDATEN